MKSSNQFIRNLFMLNQRSFEMKRSTIGVPKVSYFPFDDMKDNRSRSTFARYDIDTQNSSQLKVSGPNSHRENVTN